MLFYERKSLYVVHRIPQTRILEWAGTEPRSPALQADSLQLSHKGSPGFPENVTKGGWGSGWQKMGERLAETGRVCARTGSCARPVSTPQGGPV